MIRSRFYSADSGFAFRVPQGLRVPPCFASLKKVEPTMRGYFPSDLFVLYLD
jgi:hypothetical protein